MPDRPEKFTRYCPTRGTPKLRGPWNPPRKAAHIQCCFISNKGPVIILNDHQLRSPWHWLNMDIYHTQTPETAISISLYAILRRKIFSFSHFGKIGHVGGSRTPFAFTQQLSSVKEVAIDFAVYSGPGDCYPAKKWRPARSTSISFVVISTAGCVWMVDAVVAFVGFYNWPISIVPSMA